ncbi:MAG TPA: acetyl-CoA C-acyltransferase, partial [Thermoplasmata archaeon]|nr:acetyl-CoA C-acyltransferase [Thermoplasmata archaeon]
MTSPLPRVAILAAVRTPIGKFGGALREVPAVELGTLAVQAVLSRGGVTPGDIPFVIMGHCIQAGAGQNSARQVLRGAGIPDRSGAFTVNMVCGSGMQAVIAATSAIRAGEHALMVAGGMESMSSAPFLLSSKARWGIRYGSLPLDDAMLRDSLLDAYGDHEHMGLTGERVARHFGITRPEVDAFALRSHHAAARANSDGTFAEETVPVPKEVARPGGLDHDEGPRGDTTLERLGRLAPAFSETGVLTAGNSSQLSDGAAALLLASESEAERRGIVPIAWIHSSEVGGVAPSHVMESPIPTVRSHLERVGLEASEIDRVEHNEAFASASIAVQRAFHFPDERFNVHGGAVALGHPIGASGARIVVTLLHELARTRGRLGLATLCMGGGNGLSLIVEREPAHAR